MNINKTLLILLIALMAPILSLAQESDLGAWYIYIGSKKINKRWDWHNEVQFRNYDAVGDLEQLLLRTGIGYNLSEGNNNVLLGYGYILSENYVSEDEKESINEHRIFQQFITKQHYGRFYFTHRYRFEQRFIEGDFRMRFRYFLAINLALSNPEMVPKTWYLSLYNEIFLNTESPVFDRNRIFSGFGYKFSNSFRGELAYMNQLQEDSNRGQINLAGFLVF